MNLRNRYICIRLLQESFDSNQFTNSIVSNYFYNNNLDEQSKKNISKMVLGTVRMLGRYDYILSDIYNGKYKDLKLILKNILRLGCYQIEEMNSIPNHAAVSTSVEIAKKKILGYHGLVNALLRKFISIKGSYSFNPNNANSFKLLSHPSWLTNNWIDSFGVEKTLEICEHNNKEPDIWFRVNDENNFKEIFNYIEDSELKFHDIDSSFFKVSSPFKLIDSNYFKSGLLTIQNPLNGAIVKLLNPANSDTIIDGCSAPGGKGSFMSILAPKATIYSIDNNKNRLNKLLETISRHRITNIKPLMLDMSLDTLPIANKILIDVPCSGTGVINRRVDLRWKRTLNHIEKSSRIQYNILENTSRFLSKDGVLVYSTCSIEKKENYDIIDRFLYENKNFIIEDASNFVDAKIVTNKAINVFPGEYSLDGGFAVRLRKV